MKLALVSAIPAIGLDEDLPPLVVACNAAGIVTEILAWDDPTVSWARFDAALLRSPWDYTDRLPEFLDWCGRVSLQTRLLNPVDVVRGNTDKHYLADLEKAGVPIVPSVFAEPGEDAAKALDGFLAMYPQAAEFVVKPSVGAGSRDAQRYSRGQRDAALPHVERLLLGMRSVLMQPYLPSVDEAGETALIHFDGEFSHAIRKGPLLRLDEGPTRALFATEHITARIASEDEREVARAALAALPHGPLTYARVDLIRDGDGRPCLLELELTEPSLFFLYDESAAARFAATLVRRLSA